MMTQHICTLRIKMAWHYAAAQKSVEFNVVRASAHEHMLIADQASEQITFKTGQAFIFDYF